MYRSLCRVKGKTTCSFCKQPIDGNVKISINIPAICCHPDCFKVYFLNLVFLCTSQCVTLPPNCFHLSLVLYLHLVSRSDLITGAQCSKQLLTRSNTFCDGIIETYRSPSHLLLLIFFLFCFLVLAAQRDISHKKICHHLLALKWFQTCTSFLLPSTRHFEECWTISHCFHSVDK